MHRGHAVLLLALVLAACGGDRDVGSTAEPRTPDRSDSCEVCGMTVVDYPGPKAQLFLEGESEPAFFCSTRDFFAYLLEEDAPNDHRIQGMFVHDMAHTDWQEPHSGNDSWIPAREAFYVVGSDRRGAMGPTLASFAERAEAERFRKNHGGTVYRFRAIDRNLVVDLPSDPDT